MSPLYMLKIIVLFFNVIFGVRSNICFICQQAFECPIQRTMLTAGHATEQLIAPRCIMQFFRPFSIFLH